MDVFISYSSLDVEVADEIVAELEKNGLQCFIAPRDIRTGHVYAEEIVLGLDTAKVVVLVLTDNSNNSQHVLREIERAVSNNIPIISYRNEELKLIPAMEYFLMSNQWLDNPWNGKHEELVEAVKELCKKYDENAVKNKKIEKTSEVSKSHAAVTRMKQKKDKWKIIAFIAIALWLVTLGITLFLRTREEERADADGTQNLIDTVEPVELKIGDSYTFGNYLGEDIEWWVVSVDDGVATLLSKNVLCMKGFEGAESGHNFYTVSGETKAIDRPFSAVEEMEAFGSNDWEKSSLRAWLNSGKVNVEYIGQVPTAKVMCDGYNEYNTEPGFLNGFSSEELEAIVITTVSTEYHDWENNKISIKDTEDYVYIPSKADIPGFEVIDINVFCEPTEAAKSKDNSNMYTSNCKLYKITASDWWLRDPYGESFSSLYAVSTGHNDEMFDNYVASVAGIGVRPMMRVDISKLVKK